MSEAFTREYSESPWRWEEVGLLADASGSAILDVDDWNVSPEDAVLIQNAPILLETLALVRDAIEDSTIMNKSTLITQIDEVIRTSTTVHLND